MHSCSVENESCRNQTDVVSLHDNVDRIQSFDYYPNGEALGWLYRVIVNRQENHRPHEVNRNEHINVFMKSQTLTFTREIKGKSKVDIEINDANDFFSHNNKSFLKTLSFVFQQIVTRNASFEVSFSIHEMVELGMYRTQSNAVRAIRSFVAQIKKIKVKGQITKGTDTIEEENGIFIDDISLKNSRVTVQVNENYNFEILAPYYTIMPRFAYKLSNTAFLLVRYMLSIARMNTQAIKAKGSFTLGINVITQNIGLPTVDQVKHGRYRQLIIKPFESAIQEISRALDEDPGATDGFSIIYCEQSSTNIHEWLNGQVEVVLKGRYADAFTSIADKQAAKLSHRAPINRKPATSESKGGQQ